MHSIESLLEVADESTAQCPGGQGCCLMKRPKKFARLDDEVVFN